MNIIVELMRYWVQIKAIFLINEFSEGGGCRQTLRLKHFVVLTVEAFIIKFGTLAVPVCSVLPKRVFINELRNRSRVNKKEDIYQLICHCIDIDYYCLPSELVTSFYSASFRNLQFYYTTWACVLFVTT